MTYLDLLGDDAVVEEFSHPFEMVAYAQAKHAGHVFTLPDVVRHLTRQTPMPAMGGARFIADSTQYRLSPKGRGAYVLVLHGSSFLGKNATGRPRSDEETHDFLEGLLPDGRRIPLYGYDEIKDCTVDDPRYGVLIKAARCDHDGRLFHQSFSALRQDPMFIAMVGGHGLAEQLFATTEQLSGRELLGFGNFVHGNQGEPFALSIAKYYNGIDISITSWISGGCYLAVRRNAQVAASQGPYR